MKVLITGANGFLGKNLQLHLAEHPYVQVVPFIRSDDLTQLPHIIQDVDFVFHFAGINRSSTSDDFTYGNIYLTQVICNVISRVAETTGKKLPVVYTSSTHVAFDNDYGNSKRSAEDALFELKRSHDVPVHVFRLPNVFGKWSKPNYNSVVATFCHNMARGLPIQVDDPEASITLVHVDDVVEAFIRLIDGISPILDSFGFATVSPMYTVTVGEIANILETFVANRSTLMTQRVGTGFLRSLYSTYLSFLPVQAFSYKVPMYVDARGVFVEMLKTPDCGQFSFFTALPGITRGGHYHHTKTEKFLVIKGRARFKFRHVQSGETHQLDTNGDNSQIVVTVPGWTHEITNIGSDEMLVMLWANEIFDVQHPDTFSCPL